MRRSLCSLRTRCPGAFSEPSCCSPLALVPLPLTAPDLQCPRPSPALDSALPESADRRKRHAVEFGSFFTHTPQEFQRRDIYKTVAVALKAGEWRRVGMVMVAQALSGPSRGILAGRCHTLGKACTWLGGAASACSATLLARMPQRKGNAHLADEVSSSRLEIEMRSARHDDVVVSGDV